MMLLGGPGDGTSVQSVALQRVGPAFPSRERLVPPSASRCRAATVAHLAQLSASDRRRVEQNEGPPVFQGEVTTRDQRSRGVAPPRAVVRGRGGGGDGRGGYLRSKRAKEKQGLERGGYKGSGEGGR